MNPAATPPAPWWAVAVQTPAHSGVGGPLTYRFDQALTAGQLVRVPLGQRQVLGVVWGPAATPDQPETIRAIDQVLDLPALDPHWRATVAFAAQYYQRGVGEVALAALPATLRKLTPSALAKGRVRWAGTLGAANVGAGPALTDQQAQALAQILSPEPGTQLLFGNTGSGKTEVYLRAVADLVAQDPQAQALVLVPEINLTPQLQARFTERFGADAVVAMHSGLTEVQRWRAWLRAHLGHARMVLGTRMAVFASLPNLRLIVVDEEHDASYKQQEGARYSARDLAIYRGQRCGARVLLGSATPSLESWHLSRPADEGGRYLRLSMPDRVGLAQLPTVRRVDMNHQPKHTVLSGPVQQAIAERVAKGEQSLLLLNRRGYAPVLFCSDCGWKSACPHCSAYRVFHKADRSLRCHHCGASERVPRACPGCGNADIAPLGRGTEQLEEQLQSWLQDVRRPDGQAVRVLRIDADTTRTKGALAQQLASVHSGEVDVLVGTQMIAKGHDFQGITLVVAVNPDSALFSSDFRAPERLFALLMQAAGRAGRRAQGGPSEMLVQTFHPQHPLFEALKQHDHAAFAERELAERQAAGLPPFAHQALLRADARDQTVAQAFLEQARQQVQTQLATTPEGQHLLEQVQLYPAVPMTLQRLANVERAQMLVESPSRAALHRVLQTLHQVLHAQRRSRQPAYKGLLRWLVDVDPQAI